MEESEFETVMDSSLYTIGKPPKELMEKVNIPFRSTRSTNGIHTKSNSSSVTSTASNQKEINVMNDNESSDGETMSPEDEIQWYDESEEFEMSKNDAECFKDAVFNILGSTLHGEQSIQGYPENADECDVENLIPEDIKVKLNKPQAEEEGHDPVEVLCENEDLLVLEEWCEVLEKLCLSDPDEASYGKMNCPESKQNEEKETTVAGKEMDDQDQRPIYPGSRLTLGVTLMLIQLLAMRYHLPSEGITQLLSFICLLLPQGHLLPETFNSFRKKFMTLKNQIVFHYFCSNCLTYLPSKGTKQCPNTFCMKYLSEGKRTKNYFLEIPIIGQLQSFFKRPNFYSDIQYRFERVKKKKENTKDVYDGQLYKNMVEKGILNSPDNISFLFNTEGAAIFKSSKMQVWPLYLAINELPYKLRTAKENLIFAGLWFGEKKPCIWSFLKPFYKSLQQLEEGVEMVSPERGEFICKSVLSAETFDLPAKCLVCNGMQYNGEHSCWTCLQRGESFKVVDQVGMHGHSHLMKKTQKDQRELSKIFMIMLQKP